MLFFSFITILKAQYFTHDITGIEKSNNTIFCSHLYLIFQNNNYSYECYINQSTLYFESKPSYILYSTRYFIIENQTTENLADINLTEITNSVIVKENSRLTFYEFINMTTVDSIIDAFSSTNLNIWMRMDWMKYSSDKYSTYCQWDKATINNQLYRYFDNIVKNSKWNKICDNNEAYLHYTDGFEGEIIEIPQVTFIVCFFVILAIIIGILIALFLTAKYCAQIKKRKSIYPDDNDDSLNETN